MGKHGHRISQEVIHVTNVQKAFCILLSMCFFATLAVLPGTFFTGENVYRHLPLYRFLEKRAHMSSYEDIETYKKRFEIKFFKSNKKKCLKLYKLIK